MIRQLRLVVTAEDYDEAIAFYRDVLGMGGSPSGSSPDGGKVTLLDAGRATLEITDPRNAAFIDEVEVGRRVAGHLPRRPGGRRLARCDGSGGRGRRRARRRADRDAVALAERAPRGAGRAAADAVRGARRHLNSSAWHQRCQALGVTT